MATHANKNPKVLILAGGTGGHIMPALAVAQCLREQGVAIHWLGTRRGLESHLVPNAGFSISYIDIQGIRQARLITWLRAPWQITRALWQCYKIIRHYRPTVLLSMGGYVTIGALMGRLLGCKLLIHEQNAVAGWTNRVLAHFAQRILVAFPHAFQGPKVIHTGNPVRQSLLAITPQAFNEAHLLVLGGSQGARALNEVVPAAIALLPLDKRPQVWHQCGKNHLAATIARYDHFQVEGQIVDFIEDMAQAYRWANLVICRSGALTVAEIALVGLASILIPFPHAVDDHQTKNAQYLTQGGGALLLNQAQLSATLLSHHLLELIEAPQKRLQMAKRAKAQACVHATKQVAQICLEMSGG